MRTTICPERLQDYRQNHQPRGNPLSPNEGDVLHFLLYMVFDWVARETFPARQCIPANIVRTGGLFKRMGPKLSCKP